MWLLGNERFRPQVVDPWYDERTDDDPGGVYGDPYGLDDGGRGWHVVTPHGDVWGDHLEEWRDDDTSNPWDEDDPSASDDDEDDAEFLASIREEELWSRFGEDDEHRFGVAWEKVRVEPSAEQVAAWEEEQESWNADALVPDDWQDLRTLREIEEEPTETWSDSLANYDDEEPLIFEEMEQQSLYDSPLECPSWAGPAWEDVAVHPVWTKTRCKNSGIFAFFTLLGDRCYRIEKRYVVLAEVHDYSYGGFEVSVSRLKPQATYPASGLVERLYSQNVSPEETEEQIVKCMMWIDFVADGFPG